MPLNDILHFSIVIPLYNKCQYIKKTIDSVLSQTYPYFEVIVVDDGSTDGSASVVEGFTDKRICLIKQENKGVSAARNKGIEQSNFEFIAFIDGDDWWHEDFLLKISELIKEYHHLDLFAAKSAIIKNHQTITSFDEIFPKNKNTTFNLFEVGYYNKQAALPINSSNIVIKKKAILNAGGFDERIHFFEDYDLFMRVAIHSDVAFANFQPMSFYYQDISADNRATGKLPNLTRNLFFYTSKMQGLYKTNVLFEKYYLKLFSIYTFDYWANATYHQTIEQIASGLDTNQFPAKYRILYALPYRFSKTIITWYKIWKRQKNN
jgi:glycosyltransferase involved in cell wall biosynthesis